MRVQPGNETTRVLRLPRTEDHRVGNAVSDVGPVQRPGYRTPFRPAAQAHRQAAGSRVLHRDLLRPRTQDRVQLIGRHQRIGVQAPRPRRRPATTSPAQRAPQGGSTHIEQVFNQGRQGADRGLKTPPAPGAQHPKLRLTRQATGALNLLRLPVLIPAPGPAVALGQVMATNRAARRALTHRMSPCSFIMNVAANPT